MAQDPFPAAISAPANRKAPAYADESIVIAHADSTYTFAEDRAGFQARNIVARVQTDPAVCALARCHQDS